MTEFVLADLSWGSTESRVEMLDEQIPLWEKLDVLIYNQFETNLKRMSMFGKNTLMDLWRFGAGWRLVVQRLFRRSSSIPFSFNSFYVSSGQHPDITFMEPIFFWNHYFNVLFMLCLYIFSPIIMDLSRCMDYCVCVYVCVLLSIYTCFKHPWLYESK